ncbi:MAG TPA: carbamoyltransferase HypF [Lacibacter sp.]|nr:carbamoyltransferase HypF [Lacibacter sp.]HMO89890.1 carbamoyltransferase HypF [Lacibacter sp.]
MQTWHIHISGLVQGVGFRPHVYRLALRHGLKGTVCNSPDGVHIYATAEERVLKAFYADLLSQPPAHAVITHHEAALTAPRNFPDFSIVASEGQQAPELLLTPDFGLCPACREELFDEKNRRYHYPFTTCTECGPRYSIITALPYDRDCTSMEPFDPCWHCKKEYHDPLHRRYYSQTNSCPDCSIPLHLYNKEGEVICNDPDCILVMVKDALLNGHIVAVKGIGGYLLLCDAANLLAVTSLRERKQRPAKPFAVLFASAEAAAAEVQLSDAEREALQGTVAPIVLCRFREDKAGTVCREQVAPGLDKLGVLLPYAPLLALIADVVQRPLVATSGNVSGAPIIYDDEQALEYLGGIADFVLTHKRGIVVPQDDSVQQFTPARQQSILLRRSRGLAPNYLPVPFRSRESLFAAGADLKGSFALLQQGHFYISQYLGDQGSYDAQQSWEHTLQHLSRLLQFEPTCCMADLHPGYHSSDAARRYATTHNVPLVLVQHHEAHFAAVLAENDLLHTGERVLGVVWDGTGYGTDNNVWGGEFFLLRNGNMRRYAHLQYFPVLLGDKMAREPRLSALSLCHAETATTELLKAKFTPAESNYYHNLLHYQTPTLFTSSMGRLLDAVACLLGLCDVVSYEGQAAMLLETLAARCRETGVQGYPLPVFKNIVQTAPLLQRVMADSRAGVDPALIALRVHHSLAELVEQVAWHAGVQYIAFSGGVLQNALLVDLLQEKLGTRYHLYFHQQLSPNDECIAFGQLAHVELQGGRTSQPQTAGRLHHSTRK